MRKRWFYVPMIMLCLLLSACGGAESETEEIRGSYRDMTGCTMEAIVTCHQDGLEWEALLRCNYTPENGSTVEVLEPEVISGIRAVVRDTDWYLEYEDACLNAGTLGEETVSPATCLPRLMDALRDGWLLEENSETWNDVSALRVCLDQSGQEGKKIVSTLWIRPEDCAPLRGEIAVDGEIILTAEFTSFSFYDTIPEE